MAGMPNQYDGVILGTGHNALVLLAYLARSGLRVLAVERSQVIGGGLATEESRGFPGFSQYSLLLSSGAHRDALVSRLGTGKARGEVHRA